MILRDNLPQLQGADPLAAYNTALDQPEILDAGFKLFRAQPELFGGVVVDQNANPVQRDDIVLRCGRTVADVIALVVRASAKRYFRRKLPNPPRPQPPKLGMVERAMIAAGLAEPPAPPKRPPSRAEKLFAALRQRLLYEWQAMMIPAYSALTPQFVNDLGAYLWEFRSPEQILALAGAPDAFDPRSGLPPLLSDGAYRVLRTTDSINGDMLLRVAQLLDLQQLFPQSALPAALDQAIGHIEATGPEAMGALLPILGHDVRLFVTFLFVAYQTLGHEDYARHFGKGAMPRILLRWLERLVPLPDPTLKAMVPAFVAILPTPKLGIATFSGV